MKTQYVIRADRNFFGPSIKSELVCNIVDWCSVPAKFDSREKAELFCCDLESSEYHLSHNESGRPDYTVLPLSRVPKFLSASL